MNIKNKQKSHPYYYICPICNIGVIACVHISCDECDRYDENMMCDKQFFDDKLKVDISCFCDHTNIIANLIVQNINLQEELNHMLMKRPVNKNKRKY